MDILYATATCLSQVANCATETATQRKQIWGPGRASAQNWRGRVTDDHTPAIFDVCYDYCPGLDC